MEEDIKKYIEQCKECQQNKPIRQQRKPPLKPLEIATRPWSMITYDIIGPLPDNDEYDAIFVIVDKFTKYVELIPCDMTWRSQQIYNALYERIFARYGIPRIIVSDRDPRFRNKYMDQLSRELGIDMRYSTAYHPETDGQTE